MKERSSVEITRVLLSELKELQTISKITFTETFAAQNSEANMQKYLNENLSIEKLTHELNNPASQFYFAKQHAQLIGYLKINFPDSQTEKNLADSMEIERIYVLKEFHGTDTGVQLLNKAKELAKNKPCKYIWLGVWEENKRAISFYKKHGFVEFNKHSFKLGDDIQTDLLMKLIL